MVVPQITHFNRGFHYIPSVLGYHYFWNPPGGLRPVIQKHHNCHRWKLGSWSQIHEGLVQMNFLFNQISVEPAVQFPVFEWFFMGAFWGSEEVNKPSLKLGRDQVEFQGLETFGNRWHKKGLETLTTLRSSSMVPNILVGDVGWSVGWLWVDDLSLHCHSESSQQCQSVKTDGSFLIGILPNRV